MLIFKALHVLSMFAAVTFLIGEALSFRPQSGEVTSPAWRRSVV